MNIEIGEKYHRVRQLELELIPDYLVKHEEGKSAFALIFSNDAVHLETWLHRVWHTAASIRSTTAALKPAGPQNARQSKPAHNTHGKAIGRVGMCPQNCPGTA